MYFIENSYTPFVFAYFSSVLINLVSAYIGALVGRYYEVVYISESRGQVFEVLQFLAETPK